MTSVRFDVARRIAKRMVRLFDPQWLKPSFGRACRTVWGPENKRREGSHEGLPSLSSGVDHNEDPPDGTGVDLRNVKMSRNPFDEIASS